MVIIRVFLLPTDPALFGVMLICENQPGKPDVLVIVHTGRGTNPRHHVVFLGLKFAGFWVLLPAVICGYILWL